MKLCLLGISAFFVCVAVQAQTVDGLFPELKRRTSSSNIAQPIGGVEIQETQHLKNIPVDNQLVSSGEKSSEKRKNLSGYFEIYPHDLEIVVPVVESMQFCKGQLTMENGTGSDLQGLRVSIKYGSINLPYTFGATKSGETTTGSVNMAGPACQSLLKAATVTVISCTATGLTEDACKSKVKYILK